MIGNLTGPEIEAVLRQCKLAHLGVFDGDRVYVFPVNYGYDGASFYLHSHDGLKIGAMRGHPEVCLQVEQIVSPAHWRSVMAHGAYMELTQEAARDAALAAIVGQGETTPLSTAPYIEGHERLVVYRIAPSEITGRYERSEVLALRHHGPAAGQ